MSQNKEGNENLLKKFLLYGGIFAVGLFIIIFNRVFDVKKEGENKNNQTNEIKIEDNETLKILSDINDKFYSMNIYLTLDDDAITLEYQKIDNIEVGQKKYHKEQTEYIKTEENYYIMKDNNFVKTVDFINFNFDKTFINLANLKKLLRCEGEYSKNSIDEYNVFEYVYSLKDAAKIYNEFNNENILATTNGEILLKAYYQEKKLIYLELDTTDLYNLIENTNLKQVKYKIEITKEKEEDPSWILDKLS